MKNNILGNKKNINNYNTLIKWHLRKYFLHSLLEASPRFILWPLVHRSHSYYRWSCQISFSFHWNCLSYDVEHHRFHSTEETWSWIWNSSCRSLLQCHGRNKFNKLLAPVRTLNKIYLFDFSVQSFKAACSLSYSFNEIKRTQNLQSACSSLKCKFLLNGSCRVH